MHVSGQHAHNAINRTKFGIELQRDYVLELDSTTATKWSRHLVVHLPGAVFASNAHAGRFVKEVLQHPLVRMPVLIT